MSESGRVLSVLIVSGTQKGAIFIKNALSPVSFAPIISLNNAGEVQRLLANQEYDIALVNAPLQDEMGIQLAEELAAKEMGVLVLAPGEIYEQAAYRLEDSGVLCIAKPCSSQAILQALSMLKATANRLNQLRQKTQSLQFKMEEIRLVSRAKWLLIENCSMNEAQAHRSIEKKAMDTRQTRREVAENIIKMYNTDKGERV